MIDGGGWTNKAEADREGVSMNLTTGFGPSIARVFNGYVQFSGQSRRAGYWWFFLVSLGVGLVGFVPKLEALPTVWSLATLWPNIAVGVGRLHHVGRSGWRVPIAIIGIGFRVLLYWCIRQRAQFDNKYRPQLFMTR